MQDNNIYFGRAGQLVKLWDPTGGMLVTREIDTAVFTNKNGGTRTIRSVDGARSYLLNYGALGRDSFEAINVYQQGHMGPGPFILLDPGRRNLLTVNQSSATSALNTTSGFTVSGPAQSIASDTTQPGPLPRSLRHAFTASAPASSILTFDKPSSVWPGIPVVNRPYTFWFRASGGPVSIQLTIDWLDSTGAVLSTTTSATFALTTSGVAPRCFVTGAPPSGALWALCRVKPVLATITAGTNYVIQSPMFNEGLAPDSRWLGGTGVYPVTVMGLPERYGFAEPGMLVSPTLALQEVK